VAREKPEFSCILLFSPKANFRAILPAPDAGRLAGDPSVAKLLAYLGLYE
jgi:hypothetical protein